MSFGTKKKPLASCCQKPAKLNLNRSEGSMNLYFCTHCGEPCDVSERNTPFKGFRTLSSKREPTGELEVFEWLYEHRAKGVSEISDKPLLPPKHPMFHCQGSHILPKGAYGKYRLLKENIVMVTKEEHDEWEAEKDKEKLVDKNPQWRWVADMYYRLRLKYNTESE